VIIEPEPVLRAAARAVVLDPDDRVLLVHFRNPQREIPQGRRHPRIFGIYARLTPGESFVLVNNHDPKPLRREFQAAYPDRFGWDYLEAGPERWRVRIGRPTVDA